MTTMIDFGELPALVAVVTESSFAAAATQLETDKAQLSRIVRRMEECDKALKFDPFGAEG